MEWGEIARLVAEARFDLLEARRERKFIIDTILSVHDLAVRFARDADWKRHEKALAEIAAREGLRALMPPWFWRPGPEKLTARVIVRAKWLRAENYTLDDAWDLLSDFLRAEAESADKKLNRDRATTYLSGILAEIYKGDPRCGRTIERCANGSTV